jgi:hypothetical protein
MKTTLLFLGVVASWRLAAQSRLWRPDERALVTDFSHVRALAATPDWLFAATTHGLLIYDRRMHHWQLPVTSLDGYPPDLTRGAVADPGGNAVYLILGFGWARYDLFTRSWDRGAGPLPVAAGPTLSPEAALNQAPAAQALRALIFTDARLRTYQLTAAARTPDQPDLYLGTNGMGVVRVDPATGQSEPLTYGLLAPSAGAVAAGPGGVWVATNARPGGAERSGFTWVSDDLAATTTSEGGGAALGFTFLQGRRLVARGSYLWLATERGLYEVDNSSYRSRVFDAGRGLPTEDVTSVAPAPDGSWAGTTRGLAIVTQEGNVTRVGGAGTVVLSLLAVGESLWVGTTTGPAALAPGTPDLALAPGPPSLRVPIFGIARVGTTLVVMTGDQLAWQTLTPDTWHLTPLPPALGRPTAIAADEGGVWVGGTTGLAWVDARTGVARVLAIPFDVPAAVRDLVVDRSFLWVATDSGLVRFDRDAARR